MALVLAGQIVPLTEQDPNAVFAERVWLGDDGTIDAVTKGNAKGPAGFDGAPTVETPGLDALDIYADGHPECSEIALQGDGTQRITVPAASRVVEVVGIADDVVRQRRLVPVASRRR